MAGCEGERGMSHHPAASGLGSPRVFGLGLGYCACILAGQPPREAGRGESPTQALCLVAVQEGLDLQG